MGILAERQNQRLYRLPGQYIHRQRGSAAEITRQRPSAFWIGLLNEAGVPCGPIYTIDQTFADPQVQHLQMARPIDHPKLGPLKAVGQAINMTRTPEPEKLRPTPDLGQHTDEVVRGLGYSDDAIADLRTRAVV